MWLPMDFYYRWDKEGRTTSKDLKRNIWNCMTRNDTFMLELTANSWRKHKISYIVLLATHLQRKEDEYIYYYGRNQNDC